MVTLEQAARAWTNLGRVMYPSLAEVEAALATAGADDPPDAQIRGGQMTTEDRPITNQFGRLLERYGIDPRLVPERFTVELATRNGREGVIVDTVVPDPDGDPYGLLDADDEPVTYRRFYPEPSRMTWRNT